MKKYLDMPKRMPRREFERRAKQILQEIQKTLLPEHASEIVAINVETGEYTLGSTTIEARTAFRKRWPGQLTYLIRVDGGPVVKFHGMSSGLRLTANRSHWSVTPAGFTSSCRPVAFAVFS